ncbi:vitamin K epoxide reductase family protein [Gloeocapsa sp. PCC 73106]|uniref:vitamin K epoxide reductase family protein n=1 Tax=Gloeocapsa sp. PCC 73106 TaxID=102232 RepID=UPI0002ABBDA4|nr:vitamin K epoxide reductase family protein [Gloeocapsa sp. PCC 73106]ELR96294.1 putative membrane protein [Gloeocapsa sp. PCC 73106]
MISRKRPIPWIYRQSRWLIGAIALVGAILTAYLTFVKLQNGEVACIAGAAEAGANCNSVLNSRYGEIFGLPLSLFGSLAYLSMASFALAPLWLKAQKSKTFQKDLENWTWLFLLIGATAMTVFSAYLIFILVSELKVPCLYCITSAVLAISLLTLTIIGREWDDSGQIWFTGIIVGFITLIATLVIFSNPSQVAETPDATGRIPIPAITTQPVAPQGWEMTTISGPAEIALAEHLTKIGAKMYGAYWCPHCFEQKQLFGQEAVTKINYQECDPRGKNPQVETCQTAKIASYPSWEIKGQIYQGTQTLENLAQFSDYQGSEDFKYTLR